MWWIFWAVLGLAVVLWVVSIKTMRELNSDEAPTRDDDVSDQSERPPVESAPLG